MALVGCSKGLVACIPVYKSKIFRLSQFLQLPTVGYDKRLPSLRTMRRYVAVIYAALCCSCTAFFKPYQCSGSTCKSTDRAWSCCHAVPSGRRPHVSSQSKNFLLRVRKSVASRWLADCHAQAGNPTRWIDRFTPSHSRHCSEHSHAVQRGATGHARF